MNLDGSGLSERKKQILKAVIEAHVKVGEPVGSKYLTQYKQIALSSATIRNEMAELEEMGYLEQPHTSAGRIPSEQGYRLYVNSLMQRYRMSQNELRNLNSLLRTRLAEMDRMLDRAAKMISALTSYASISVKQPQHTVLIAHFKIVMMSSEMFILVMITTTDTVKTRQVHTDFSVTADMIERLEILLNTYVAGTDPAKLTFPVILEMEKKLPECESIIPPIIKAVYEVVHELDSGDIHIEGIRELLKYPEYSDRERFGELLSVFDNKEDLLEMISQGDENKLNVYIGSDNAVSVMNNSSLIFKTVKSDGRVVGAIGVIGPCRMDYSRVITTIEYLANSISGEKELDTGNEAPDEDSVSDGDENKIKDE